MTFVMIRWEKAMITYRLSACRRHRVETKSWRMRWAATLFFASLCDSPPYTSFRWIVFIALTVGSRTSASVCYYTGCIARWWALFVLNMKEYTVGAVELHLIFQFTSSFSFRFFVPFKGGKHRTCFSFHLLKSKYYVFLFPSYWVI